MAKAALGNTGALGRLGIATKDAEGKALTYEQVLRQAAATMGGAAAAAADTLAGKQARLSEQWSEVKEAVGTALLPVLERLTDWVLTKAIPYLQALGAKYVPMVRAAWERFGAKVAEYRPILEETWANLREIGAWMEKHGVPVLIKMASIDLTKTITMLGYMAHELNRIIDAFKWLDSHTPSIVKKLAGSPLPGWLSKIPGLAAGGPVAAGQAYVVGERGPELFLPTRSGTIIPNGRTPSSGAAAGGIVININGPVTDRVQAARWIRDALDAGRRAGVTIS
jgi:hypothetical protein